MPPLAPPGRITRRLYLTVKTIESTHCSWFAAIEAVSSTALEHPEWDMDEQRTYADWERHTGARRPRTPRRRNP